MWNLTWRPQKRTAAWAEWTEECEDLNLVKVLEHVAEFQCSVCANLMGIVFLSIWSSVGQLCFEL